MCGCLDESGVSVVFHSLRTDLPEDHVFLMKWSNLAYLWRPLLAKVEILLLGIEDTPLDM